MNKKAYICDRLAKSYRLVPILYNIDYKKNFPFFKVRAKIWPKFKIKNLWPIMVSIDSS